MHLSRLTTHPSVASGAARAGDERGFSMLLIIMVMFVSAMFVAAGFAAANGDLPLSGNWRDRKTAYAAAEAGLNFYQYHLDQDNDYWLKCTAVNPPNGTEASPVNQMWDGTSTRVWRTVPGSQARYTIELLPAPGKTQCVRNDQTSMIDPATGTFRIRVTGQASPNSKVKRSIVASFRRKSFLDYLWFTHLETTDPKNYAPSDVSTAASRCSVLRPARDAGFCNEISFVSGDWMHGPMHTDDNFLICGAPDFGRVPDADNPNPTDVIEASGNNPTTGWVGTSGCSGNAPDVHYGSIVAGVDPITLPTTNTSLKSLATGIYSFTGKTTIVLNGSRMTVTNAAAHLSNADEPMPANGVIYVDNDPNSGCTSVAPRDTDYTDSTACGNLYVGGHSATSLTLAAKNDVIVTPTANPPDANGARKKGLLRDSDGVMLGLVADNFVRVYHAVTSSNVNVDPPADLEIDAAILALSHSFTVDNYNAGAKLGSLTIDGAIAQLYRGAVGTHSGTTITSGYLKDYWYDDRLKYQTPPYFLQPVAASWHVTRRNEQVPAT